MSARAKKVHHCTGCRQWTRDSVDEKCCTCCTAPDGSRPGQGVDGDPWLTEAMSGE